MTSLAPLAQLGLTDDELAALRRNGYVGEEPHRQGKIFKLRFRVAGVQRVRSLGRDPARASEICLALTAWQLGRRVDLQSRKIAQQVSHQLRECKRQLEPYVEANGFRFHGRAIRRPRRIKA